jgi:hypothetical protein
MNQRTFPHLFLIQLNFIRRTCIIVLSLSMCIALTSCTTVTKVAPLGPESFISYGSTNGQNKFDPLNNASCIIREGDHTENPLVKENFYASGDPPLNVLCLLADTKDHRFTGTPASLQTYRDGRFSAYQPNTNSFWNEASFSNVSINMTMPTRMIQMSGTFNDYFNRSFVQPTLTTFGLATAIFPLAFAAGEKATITVRDIYDKDTDVTINPPASVADFNQLRMLWTNAIAAVGMNPNWLTTDVSSGELVFKLDRLLVGEGSFIRPKSGSALAKVGLSGPMELPGDGAAASLTGKPVPGNFPVTLTVPGATMKFEVRDKDLKTRQYFVTVPAGNYPNPAAITSIIVPKLNADFNWVQALPIGANQIGLSVVPAFSGPHAAIRIIFGVGHSALGLDGPARVDGVVSAGLTDLLRGDWKSITAEALSIYVRDRANELGITVDSNPTNITKLNQIVQNELVPFDSYMVLFADDLTVMPSGKRGGADGGDFDISVPGVGGFTYTNQVNASLVLGEGTQPWQTYAHEFGHNLGMWDLYQQPDYDSHFDSTNSYLRAWSLMDQHTFGSHPEGWHKNLKGFVSAGTLRDVFAPPPGQTEHHKFTVIPLEYPEADYSTFGDFEFPIAQYIRIHLAMKHWIGVENREPGKLHSQSLPSDTNGRAPAVAPGRPGGILVTDVVDPWEALYRTPVSVMNPHGTGGLFGFFQARGMKAGDSFPLTSTYPKYDGIDVNVIEEVPGPVGKPKALKVDVVWGPGNFVELGMRPWQAPNVYGTPDIWLDWPGNGNENFPSSDPPVGTGDQVHWSPDGTVVNLIKVRVHNWGTILGKQVVVRAFINELGMGDHGKFTPFPDSAPQDIPAGGFKDYVFEWKPIGRGHTCILAVIFKHESDLSDLDPDNNYAQENVDDFWPDAGSPYKPVEFQFKLTNDFEHDVEAELRPSQLPDGMDVELERRYIKMLPKQELILKGRLYTDITKIPPDPREQNRKYCFNLHAFKRTPDSVLPFGGITVNVHPGYQAKIDFDKIYPERRGTAVIVVGKLKGPFAGNETVDVAITGSDGLSYGGTGKTDNNGDFQIAVDKVPGGSGSLMLYYFGPKMTAAFEGPIKVNLPHLNP